MNPSPQPSPRRTGRGRRISDSAFVVQCAKPFERFSAHPGLDRCRRTGGGGPIPGGGGEGARYREEGEASAVGGDCRWQWQRQIAPRRGVAGRAGKERGPFVAG